MKALIFTLITLSFAFSHAGRIDNYYGGIAETSNKAHDFLSRKFFRAKEHTRHPQQEETATPYYDYAPLYELLSQEELSDLRKTSSDLDIYKMLAEKGEAGAQHAIGDWYYEGIRGVPQNYKLALHWTKKAAEQGHSYAQNTLGHMYHSGIEVSQNYKLAFYWFKESANSENSAGQYNLAGMYLRGEGVPQNYKLALQWYKKSARKVDAGDKPGILSSDTLGYLYYFYGEDASGIKDYKNTPSWVLSTKKMLGLLGSKEDQRKAFYWYMKAAKQGYAPSQHALGLMFLNGDGVASSTGASYYWLTKAAQQGHADAQKILQDNSWLSTYNLLLLKAQYEAKINESDQKQCQKIGGAWIYNNEGEYECLTK